MVSNHTHPCSGENIRHHDHENAGGRLARVGLGFRPFGLLGTARRLRSQELHRPFRFSVSASATVSRLA